MKSKYLVDSMISENVATGKAKRAKRGGIAQRVGASEKITNAEKASAATDHAAAKKRAGDDAHAAATKAGKSPYDAEYARNKAHRAYEKQQKKLNNSYIPSFAEFIYEGAAWTKKAGKSSSGGLNEKGRKSYERENPGSDLKAPSKKVGNPRRASFCARMKGMKSKLTSKKTASDPDSRINKSLRAWNC